MTQQPELELAWQKLVRFVVVTIVAGVVLIVAIMATCHVVGGPLD
jgi:hypothetical protein